MNGETLYQALGYVDEALVAQAGEKPFRRTNVWKGRRALLAAACLCLLLAGCALVAELIWGAGVTEMSTGDEESGYRVEGTVEPVPAEAFSPEVYQALEEDWRAWEALSQDRRLLSGHMPGTVSREFASWQACAEFLGVPLANPLEEDPDLMGAAFRVILTGNEERELVYANVRAGYALEEGRRAELSVGIYTEASDRTDMGFYWNEPVDFTADAFSLSDGQTAPVVVAEPRRENADVGVETYFLRDNALYNLSVRDRAGTRDAALAALEDLLKHF